MFRNLAPNFTHMALIMWAYSPQNHQNCYFLAQMYPLYPKGVRFLMDFFNRKLGLRKESQVYILTPNFTPVALKNVGLQPPNR